MSWGVVQKPLKIPKNGLIWSRVQILYWSVLHKIDDFPFVGAGRITNPFDYMFSVKQEILRNKDAESPLKEELLDDLEKHIRDRDGMPRRPNHFAAGAPGFDGHMSRRMNPNRLGIYKHGTPIPAEKIIYNDDGPIEIWYETINYY
eukprot:NODE_2259_length_593_cov_149.965074_g1785_i0.p2 GENE.NODE_2259_length_593_cov_149.965074_g1785_i0~~NODE_2259_length_593_cov_149.965074_g1785_i0.p2  ORF type:complete len:163 (+),score=43.38 NODE_2259_length_593_cov_149.965074_g1785_i0:54-491(+)